MNGEQSPLSNPPKYLGFAGSRFRFGPKTRDFRRVDRRQFTITTLILATVFVAFGSLIYVKARESAKIIDFTGGRSSICEIHGQRMQKQLVAMTHGRPLFDPNGDTEWDACRRLFPHANQPYRTGYCLPTRQSLARVFVCPSCTRARGDWYASPLDNQMR